MDILEISVLEYEEKYYNTIGDQEQREIDNLKETIEKRGVETR